MFKLRTIFLLNFWSISKWFWWDEYCIYFTFQVDWSRLGADESKIETDLDLERYQVEYHEDRHNRDRVKHLLKINAPTTEDLNSVFVCSARNKIGQIRKTIPIKGKTCVSVFLFLHLQLVTKYLNESSPVSSSFLQNPTILWMNESSLNLVNEWT